MATKRKDYEELIDPRYTASTARLAGRNDAAYQTEKLANEVYDLGYDEGKAANQAAIDKATANAASNSNGVPTSVKPTSNPASYQAAIKTAEKKDLVSKDLLDEYMNRGKFSFNAATNPLYQQYKEQFLDAGKRAMEDTLGKAVSLTGGHDNSYANAVAQQVNDDYAARAADKIPELYQLALDRYNQEGQELLNKYEVLYGREQDQAAADWRQKEWDLQLERYRVADKQWASEFGLKANAQAWAQYIDERQMTLNEARFFLEQEIERGNLDIAKANQALKELEFKHNQQMDYISADQNQQKINLSWADLDSHINGSYYKGDTSGSSPTTTPKAGYNSDGTKKRTDKEIQAAADGLWKDYLKAEGSTKTLDTFMTRLLNQYSDDADRIMSTLENRAAAIDDRITRKGSKTYAYLD